MTDERGYTYPEAIAKFFPPGWAERVECPSCLGGRIRYPTRCTQCNDTGMIDGQENSKRESNDD